MRSIPNGWRVAALVVIAWFAVTVAACTENESRDSASGDQPVQQAAAAPDERSGERQSPNAPSTAREQQTRAEEEFAKPDVQSASPAEEDNAETLSDDQSAQSDTQSATHEDGQEDPDDEADEIEEDITGVIYLKDYGTEYKECPGTQPDFDPTSALREWWRSSDEQTRSADFGRFPPDSTMSNTVAIDLAVSRWHVCALMEDGTVRCWGRTAYEPQPAAGRFTQIDGGCGLRPDGTVDCWDGPLSAVPFEFPPGHFTNIAVDEDRLCGLRPDGSADCCGYGYWPGLVPRSGPFVEIEADGSGNCAIGEDSTIECWGQYSLKTDPAEGAFTDLAYFRYTACGLNDAGEIVCWALAGSEVVPPPAGEFTRLAAGGRHICAVGSDNVIRCWDDYPYSRFRSKPTYSPREEVVDLGVGYDFACGLSTSGSVQCWGNIVDSWEWPQLPRGRFSQVVIGRNDDEVCGLRENGVALCWGYTLAGKWTPPGPYSQISVGSSYACGVRLDGAVGCWGEGYPDEFVGEREDEPEVVRERLDGPFVQVDVHADEACAVRADGSVACWNTPGARLRRSSGRSAPGKHSTSLPDVLVPLQSH